MRRRLRLPALLLLLSVPAAAAERDDPKRLLPSARPGLEAGPVVCGEVPGRPLTLPDLIDLALCRNPATAISWAGVRGAAANVGIAEADNYPQVNLSGGPQYTWIYYLQHQQFGGRTTDSLNSTASLAISYLLWDFGGRAARIDAAKASQRAALANFADSAQGVAYNTITAYNSLIASRAAVAAAEATVAFARSSLEFARGRERAGAATPADTLQAATNAAQADLTLVQARGDVRVAQGQLAVSVGLPPQTTLVLAPVAPLGQTDLLREDVVALIDEAERLRPDLAAARANQDAAAANVAAARANRRPTISAQASSGGSYAATQRDSITSSVGLSITVPLFNGYARTYQVAAARAQFEQAAAQTEQVRQGAGLDVWTSYADLDTQLKALASARTAIDSATASANLAQGRYKAGVGTFNDLLNAQSALATARQQLVSAEFGVRNAQAQLAQSIGRIGATVDEMRGSAR